MEITVSLLGQVYLVEQISTGKKFVSKRIPIGILGESEKRASLQEANLLRYLKHVHIVEYIESYIENNTLVIIMEYCSGLFKRRGSFHSHQKMQRKGSEFSRGTHFKLVFSNPPGSEIHP